MKFEEVIIKEYPKEVARLFTSIWCLNRDIEYLRPVFREYTKGLDIDLNKEFIEKVLDGSIEDYINSLVAKELDKQHPFTRPTFENSFNSQINELYPKLESIKAAYDKINEGDDIIPEGILEKYATVDGDGEILLDEDEYTPIIIQDTALKVETQAQKDFYGKFDTFLESLESLRNEIGDNQTKEIISKLTPDFNVKGISKESIKERCKSLIELFIKQRK
ncbi:hypothetical protein [Sphingobacterium multivorum]|uniref:hypothetical protein n=1 Tax=Sphingobacterium multivorum TaxID=28454 RepID=UPI0028A9B691|nr:hypothetical protein [Sphingobacterium multivorum]